MPQSPKNKTILFITVLIIISLVSSVLSYKLIMENYTIIENKTNSDNIHSLVNKIENKIDYIHKVSLEYSNLMHVNSFLKSKNHISLYKSLIEKESTISYLLIEYNKNVIKYKNPHFFVKNVEEFQNEFIERTNYADKIKTVIKHNNTSMYISKLPVYNKNKINGYIYVIEEITDLELKNVAELFSYVSFIENDYTIEGNNINKSSKYFSKIKVDTYKNDNLISNNIAFYNLKSKLAFKINAQNKREILNEARMIILISMILISMLIIALVYLVYKYRKDLQAHNDLLEKRVEDRTIQLKNAMVELEKANLKLYDIAHTDFLTKTMNRRNFFIHAQNLFSFAKKNDQDLTALMIDIDNFKTFNDKYGHDIGDKVLVMFSDCIKSNIDDDDVFGRLGGEEFSLLIPNTNLENAIKKAERLKNKIENVELIIEDTKLNITASFGVSDNKNCSNIDEMLQKADKLLYNAKKSGKNQVRSRLNISS